MLSIYVGCDLLSLQHLFTIFNHTGRSNDNVMLLLLLTYLWQLLALIQLDWQL